MSRYKMNTQSSSHPIYKCKHTKKEIRETIHKGLKKYLGINLTEKVRDLHNENSETLKKKLKRIPEDKKTSHDYGINILKMAFLPEAITTKLPIQVFTEIATIILNLV